MSTGPTLASELVTLILEHLWTDLTTHAHSPEPVEPSDAPFVFAPLTLVSRAFRKCALPFFVRRFDRRDPVRFLEFVDKYDLVRHVQFIHANPRLPPLPKPEKARQRSPDSDDETSDEDGDEAYSASCFSRFQADEKRCGDAWHALLTASAPTLRALEIVAPIRASEPMDHARREHLYESDGISVYRVLNLSRKARFDRLENLKVNVRARTTLRHYAQHQDLFPAVRRLDLGFTHPRIVSGNEIEQGVRPWTGLRALVLRRLFVQHTRFDEIVRPLLVSSSATTLRVLDIEIQMPPLFSSDPASFADLFRHCAFPHVTFFRLKSDYICCTDSHLFDLFPSVSTASIPINVAADEFPALPQSLRSLSVTYHTCLSVASLVAALEQQPGASLTLLEILSADLDEEHTYYIFMDRREDELAPIVRICEELDIVLAGDIVQFLARGTRDARWQTWYQPDDLRFAEAPSDEQGSTASESASVGDSEEDDAMDYDAEDDVTFRSLWSLEKRKALDVKDAFKLLEPHIKAGVSADVARRTIEELLE